MKTCSTCRKELPSSEFYKNKAQKKDGLANNCKKCSTRIMKEWREKNPEKVRKIGRKNKAAQRTREGPEVTKKKWNDWYDKNKEHRRAYSATYRDKHKAHAHNALQYALRVGNILRPERCSFCEKECKPDAHHEDYNKPLEVVWLCRPCHTIHHK